jgi:hypothetical protein
MEFYSTKNKRLIPIDEKNIKCDTRAFFKIIYPKFDAFLLNDFDLGVLESLMQIDGILYGGKIRRTKNIKFYSIVKEDNGQFLITFKNIGQTK